eukprot:6179515-Pleurochrysis_carterae.AAC.2
MMRVQPALCPSQRLPARHVLHMRLIANTRLHHSKMFADPHDRFSCTEQGTDWNRLCSLSPVRWGETNQLCHKV